MATNTGIIRCIYRNHWPCYRLYAQRAKCTAYQALLLLKINVRRCNWRSGKRSISATSFTKAFKGTGFFNTSFPAYGHTGTGFNRVTGALMSRAVTGVYPNMQLNYPQVLVSKGRLPGAQYAKATVKNGALHFSFADNSTDGIAAADDTVILVAYCPALQQAYLLYMAVSEKIRKLF